MLHFFYIKIRPTINKRVTMKHTLEEICSKFNINPNDILNAYCYGSRVYGTNTEDSDYDYILVHKSAFIGPDKNAFKENAKTSDDGKIQIINFSRTGFKAELETFNMSCLECMFLPEEFIIQEKVKYKIDRFDIRDFVKNVIIKASDSWFSAKTALKEGNTEFASKAFYHSFRILDFAYQIKTYGKIKHFDKAQYIKSATEHIMNSKNPLGVISEIKKDYFNQLKEDVINEKSI